MTWVKAVIQRFRDWRLTGRTLAAVAERECKHDGSDPTCRACWAAEW